MLRHPSLVIPFLAAVLVAQAPMRVDLPPPADLDLRNADAASLVPRDNRDAAAVEAAQHRWTSLVEPLKAVAAVRLVLPSGEGRLSLLLAAAQALKAQSPAQRVYLAFDPKAVPVLDEVAWGALDGGALLPADLGPDPAPWRTLLAQAQGTFPGRPWTLWLPLDPGPLASTLLGDGGRLVVPSGGPTARLAALQPEGFTEVEGGQGDLTLRNRAGAARRWIYVAGSWAEAPLPRERNEVSVTAADTYDVGALLARVRSAQLRNHAAFRTLQAKVDVDLHLQGRQGLGGDLGFTFSYFEAAGDGAELLQQEVRFNGVKAKLHGEVQIPIVEAKATAALPVSLALKDNYRYRDGGPDSPGRRILRYEPVDADPRLYRGELVVEEATGRIFEERREREGLGGVVKSERAVITYGEVGPGYRSVTGVRTFERWTTSEGVAQVQRTFRYRDFALNDGAFEARRQAARSSKDTMLKETPEGVRYFTRQADGTRKVEERAKSSGRAIGGLLLLDPSLSPPVFPALGLVYFDFNAFNKGIQVNALTALVFNRASLTIPRVFGGFDLSASATALLLNGGERPVKNGRLSDRDEVGRRFGNLTAELGHDLGAGFRFEAQGRFQYDDFTQAPSRDAAYRTPGFALPPSGWTRELSAQASWLFRGFQVQGHYGWGQRPDGTYGTLADPQQVPDQGAFRRWGGALSLDRQLKAGFWLHGETGYGGGRAFDRFNALNLGGLGGDVRIAGIRSNSIAADRLAYAKAGVVLPSGPSLRLSLTLDRAWARSLDDQKSYGFTGLGIAGDLPGFWWFTTVRVDLGVGLQSDVAGVKTVNGFIALLRVF